MTRKAQDNTLLAANLLALAISATVDLRITAAGLALLAAFVLYIQLTPNK